MKVKVSLGSAHTFVTFEKDHFKINPSPRDAGAHTVKIQLVDDNEIPKGSDY